MRACMFAASDLGTTKRGRVLRLVVLLATVGLVGGLLVPVGIGARPAPSLSVTPTTVDFGSVAQGDTRSQALTLTNTGIIPIRIGGWGVSGGPFTFASTDDTCPLVYLHGHGALLLPGRTCTFTVIAQTYSFPPGGISYYPPGTYQSVFYVLDVGDAEIVHVPLTVTVF
jgi:hypothetical protein